MKRIGFLPVLHLLLFCSGGLALIYEILWMRKLSELWGATTQATAATLGGVFIGLTAGSLFFGGWSAKVRRPIRYYGLLEMAAGFSALLTWFLFGRFEENISIIYPMLAASTISANLMKLAFTCFALFLPTFFMGGTLPVLSMSCAGEGRSQGGLTGGFYAANTLGAAIGALSVPFFWLPHFGIAASHMICIAVSILIGCVALAYGLIERPHQKRPEAESAPAATGRVGYAPAIIAFLSGSLLFVFQVTCTRMFAQVHENSVYSFALVVSVFIIGLAVGAMVVKKFFQRIPSPTIWIGRAWIVAGLLILISPKIFYLLTNGLSYLEEGGGWGTYASRLLILVCLTTLVPVIVSSIAFPVLIQSIDGGKFHSQSYSRSLGWLLALNTLGTVVGSYLAAFVLPALLGLWGTLAAIGIVVAAAGELYLNGKSLQSMQKRVLIYIAIAFVFWGSNPVSIPRTKIAIRQNEKLLSVREGGLGIVAVVETPRSRRMKLDNFYVLGGTASAGDERMQTHIPLLLHPTPKHVAFLGLGTGITAGAALLHPVEKIVAAEIVPEVVESARQYFSEANLNVVDSDRTSILPTDARSFLRGSGQKFDVIIGDLFVPWHRGEALMYSSDQFNAAKKALNPGGIFCQWLPMFQLSRGEFDIVAATFLDVFPNTTIWRGDFAPDRPAVALIGHADGDLIDPSIVERRVGEMKRDSLNLQLLHPAGLWIYYGGVLDASAANFSSIRRNHVDQPWLELESPLAHAGSTKGLQRLFVGRKLHNFLNEIRLSASDGSKLTELGTDRIRWWNAGALIAEGTILFSEGKRADASAKMAQATPLIPPEIRVAILGGAGL